MNPNWTYCPIQGYEIIAPTICAVDYLCNGEPF